VQSAGKSSKKNVVDDAEDDDDDDDSEDEPIVMSKKKSKKSKKNKNKRKKRTISDDEGEAGAAEVGSRPKGGGGWLLDEAVRWESRLELLCVHAAGSHMTRTRAPYRRPTTTMMTTTTRMAAPLKTSLMTRCVVFDPPSGGYCSTRARFLTNLLAMPSVGNILALHRRLSSARRKSVRPASTMTSGSLTKTTWNS
jgi:hypothetical protein